MITTLHPPPQISGKHARAGNTGVIYFPSGGPDDLTNNARVLNVSPLDGQEVLLEGSRTWLEGPDARWLVSRASLIFIVAHPTDLAELGGGGFPKRG